MTRELTRGNSWIRVNGRRRCPVCQKAKGCLIAADGLAAICLRVGSEKEIQGGLGGFYHSLGVSPVGGPNPLVTAISAAMVLPGARRKAEPTLLNRMYQALLEQHALSSEDRCHLSQVRGLSVEAVAQRQYRSWGQFRSLRHKIARSVFEAFGAIALDVPGVILRKQMGESPEYVTLAGAPGIAIPVRDVQGRIAGIQLRVHEPKPGCGKYRWLSSASQGGATAGTPVHVARPLQASSSKRVWLTEGPLKADIACDRLQEIVLAIPGVRAINDFIPTLDVLVDRQEISELVIALDSDWHQNLDVGKARLLLAERAARIGIPVWLADWDRQYKGLDDLLLAGGKPKLQPYRVQGNGPRQLVSKEHQKKAAPPERALSLEEARDKQTKTLKKFLQTKKVPETQRGLLMRAKPGVGKSSTLTAGLNQFIKKRSRKRALVFVPRHELGAGPGREKWNVVRGRTHKGSGLISPCSHPNLQSQLAHLRVPGQMGCELCPALQLCKSNQERNKGPFYHAQFQQSERISVHPAQHFLLPSLIQKAAVVVLDDCDLRNLAIDDIQIGRLQVEAALAWARRHQNHAYHKAQALLEVLLAIMNDSDRLDDFCCQEIELFERLENIAVVKTGRDLEQILQTAQESQEPAPLTEEFQVQAELPVRFVKEFAEVLHWEYQQFKKSQEQECPGWNCRIRLLRQREVQWNLKQRKDLPLTALKGKDLVIVDASLTLAEAQQLFPDRQWTVIDPPVEMPSSVRIVQFPEQSWGKSRLLSSEKVRQQALGKISDIIERHPNQSIAVLTHKCFVPYVKEAFPQVKVGHFFGQRGSNQFQECDVEIVFGTPYPNPDELQRQAEALYWDQERVLRQTVLQPQCLGQEGQQDLWVSVRTHADPRLCDLQRSKCQEELIQAIYRIRPLSVEEGKLFPTEQGKRTEATVYVFSSLPIPQLKVQLVRKPPSQSTVIDLSAAAEAIHQRQERITEERLAIQAHVNRWKARQFLAFQLRSRLGEGPPPGQGPPPAA